MAHLHQDVPPAVAACSGEVLVPRQAGPRHPGLARDRADRSRTGSPALLEALKDASTPGGTGFGRRLLILCRATVMSALAGRATDGRRARRLLRQTRCGTSRRSWHGSRGSRREGGEAGAPRREKRVSPALSSPPCSRAEPRAHAYELQRLHGSTFGSTFHAQGWQTKLSKARTEPATLRARADSCSISPAAISSSPGSFLQLGTLLLMRRLTSSLPAAHSAAHA